MEDKTKFLIKVKMPHGTTINFDELCERQYAKTINLMSYLENQLGISLHQIPNFRKDILDIANFTKRLPNIIDIEVDTF